MKSTHVLLARAIDYAGLFPPAGLDMESAVTNYAGYLAGDDAWALGRFVVPVSRLDEFASAAAPFLASTARSRWHLAALSGSSLTADLEAIERFNKEHAGAGAPQLLIDTLERKAGSVAEVKETMHRIPPQVQGYLELPTDRDPTAILQCLAGSALRAKVRTGGVTPEAFPRAADLLRFMTAAILAKVPFKATAGLHHPLRAEYRLTYAPDSPRGRMFGFLNVFLAAAGLNAGMSQSNALALLEEESPTALRVEDDGIRWRQFELDLVQLRAARRSAIIAFGSCSFTEPIGELQALRFLEPRVHQA